MDRLQVREKELILPVDHIVVPIEGDKSIPIVTPDQEVPEGFLPYGYWP